MSSSPTHKIRLWVGLTTGTLTVIAIIIGISLYLNNGMAEAIKNQLNALHAGDVVIAYSYTSKGFQQATSLEDFKKFIDRYPVFRTNTNTSFSERNIGNYEGTASGSLQSIDGLLFPVEYRLIKEDKKWKIMAIHVAPPISATAITKPSVTSSTTIKRIAAVKPVSLPYIYQNYNSKYSINYPLDWMAEQPDKSTVILGGKKGTPSYQTTVNIQTVLPRKYGGQFKNPMQFINVIKDQAQELSTDVKIIGEGPIVLPETPERISMEGRYLLFSYTYKGQTYQQMQFVFLRNDGEAFYAWGYTAPLNRYNIDYATAKAMFAAWSVY